MKLPIAVTAIALVATTVATLAAAFMGECPVAQAPPGRAQQKDELPEPGEVSPRAAH